MYHSRAEIFSGDRIRVTGATKDRQSIDPWMESGAWILRKLKRKRKDGCIYRSRRNNPIIGNPLRSSSARIIQGRFEKEIQNCISLAKIFLSKSQPSPFLFFRTEANLAGEGRDRRGIQSESSPFGEGRRTQRLISKHRKGIKLEARPISRGIPSLIRDARFDPDARGGPFLFNRSGHLWRFNGFNDHTCTAVSSPSFSLSLFWSLFRVATPADKNRGRTVRIDDDDRPPRGTHDVRGDRSLSSSPVAGDEPRRRRRRRQRPRGAHTEARFHLAECIKPDVVLANGTK